MLVRSVVYRGGQKVAEIEPEEIHAHLTRPDCFVWVALADPDEKALELMQAQFNLHPLAVEDAGHGHQRPKIEEYGDQVFVILHMIELAGEEIRRGEVAIFVGRNYVLSVRRGVERGFGDVRARCEQEPDLLRRGPGYVLYALMDAVVDRYFPPLHALETELERIEERIFAQTSARENIEDLYALKRRLITFRHAVNPLLESLANISGARVPPVCGGMQEYFRDISDHLQRLNQTIESVRDTVSTATSVNLSMITLQESETMKRLAAYAALIAVPTMIVGIYGMNFDHMPELRWRYGYPMVLATMGILDAYLFYRLRKARWL